jgi:hypothetical protein
MAKQHNLLKSLALENHCNTIQQYKEMEMFSEDKAKVDITQG